MPVDKTDNYLRFRQGDPGDFQKGSFRTIVLDKSKGIKAVIGRPKGKSTTKIQSVLFPKDYGTARAKTWLKKNKMKTGEEMGDNAEKASILEAILDTSRMSIPREEKRSRLTELCKRAKFGDIDISEEFLNADTLEYPLFMPHIFETLIAFNSGAVAEHEWYQGHGQYYGKKLARKLNSYVYRSDSEEEYDESGKLTATRRDGDSEDETTYEYQDGEIVVMRSKSSNSSDTSFEFNEKSSSSSGGYSFDSPSISYAEREENGGIDELVEASHHGDMIKAMRRAKKLSRKDMSADMPMTASRLAEIEDGDAMEDGELDAIAGGLGVSAAKLKRLIGALKSIGDSSSEETRNGNSETIRIIKKTVKVVENRKPSFTKVTYEERMVRGESRETHKFFGSFISETVKKMEDGTTRFEVPLFKLGELTSNGNRYTRKCAENLVNHLGAKTKKLERAGEDSKRTILDIEVEKYLEGRIPDMMATHRARLGQGNPLLEKAGRILGGRIGTVENDPAFILIGKTIKGFAGESIAAQIDEKMLRGVSLFALPTEFEENNDGGADVDDMHLVGADFTDEGGNLVQFRDSKNAGFMVMN